MMESPAKKLRQQLAILAARQGDPEAPASGTLLARRQRLHEELAHANSGEHSSLAGAAVASKVTRGGNGAGFASRRSSSVIRRDIRLVDQEIDELQRRIKEIDRIIADAEHKGGGEQPRHKPRPAAPKRVSR